MKIAQEDILRYLRDRDPGCRYELVSGSRVRVFDQMGGSRTYTSNIYSDIMDAETREIVAVSDVPHDLEMVDRQRPKSWTSSTSNFG